jgi:hypothetical protein
LLILINLRNIYENYFLFWEERLFFTKIPLAGILFFRTSRISETPKLTADEVFQAAFKRKEVVPLVRGWQLRSSSVMGNQRLEITGVRQEAEVTCLKAVGCITEMINWKLRVFIPVNEQAVGIIDKIRQLAN